VHANNRARRQGLAVPILDLDPPAFGQPVNGQEPEVMGRELVFDARIAEPDDQFHALPVTLPFTKF
jgi:hypothetical protein